MARRKLPPEKHDPSFIVGPTTFGRMFKRGPDWGAKRLREWLAEQDAGGPIRVFRKPSGYLYTTVAIVDQYMPRARVDAATERRFKRMEEDLDRAFTRIAELERRVGMRR